MPEANYQKAVEEYYDSLAETEWHRLDWHKMEFAICRRTMWEFIPSCSDILDIGGGPGRYSFELTKAGHHVSLMDLSAANIAFAKKKAAELGMPLCGYYHGNALDLGEFNDHSFDVVLLMGPLYHLITEAERQKAIREAARVLKPGGYLFATFVTRYAFLLYLLKDDPASISTYPPELITQILSDGVNLVSGENPGFTNAYFAHPSEITPLMESAGLTQLRLTAIESLISFIELSTNNLPQNVFDQWVDLSYRLGTDPITWGNSEHMLYVGTR